MMRELKNTFKSELHNTDFDIKAEVFISALALSEEEEVKYNILFSDFFKRRFSNDIVDIEEDPNRNNYLNVSLSRPGFYDYFPESFFHKATKVQHDATNMAQNYKARKQEETRTRKFFTPLENEFFNFNLFIDQEEVSILESVNNIGLADVLKGLWDIDQTFDSYMATKLLKAMPFLNRISGKVNLCVELLKAIIDDQDIEVTHTPLQIKDNLGVKDYILGESFATYYNKNTFLKKYIITVKNIKNPELIEHYLPNGKIYKVIEFFLDYTIPLEADYEIDFTIADKLTCFELNDKIYGSRLNITTTL